MYKKEKIWIIVLSLVCIILISMLYSPTTKAPKTSTKIMLKNIYQAILILEKENHLSIGEQLRQVHNGNSLQEKFIILLSNNSEKLCLNPKIIEKQYLYDGYGNHYNLDYKNDFLLKRGNVEAVNMNFDVIIWSSGKNGINEYGFRDDIYLDSENR